MANRKTSELDRIRAQTWVCNLAHIAGVNGFKNLEERIRERVGQQRLEASNRLGQYFSGKYSVRIKRRPGCRGEWVDLGEIAYPGSAVWFDTPVWYLLESEPFYAQELWECVRLLPGRYQEILLNIVDEHAAAINLDTSGLSAGLMLRELWADRIYELAVRPSAWSLGALACAFRRAEFAGQVPVFRLAAVGILWTLDQLITSEAPLVREMLSKLRQYAADYFASLVIPLGATLRTKISTAEVERFSVSVEKFRQRRAAVDGKLRDVFSYP